jgi:tetratricopeptide (TPR) repeat protein
MRGDAGRAAFAALLLLGGCARDRTPAPEPSPIPAPPARAAADLLDEARWLLRAEPAARERLDRAERLLAEVIAADPANAAAEVELARVALCRARDGGPETATELVASGDRALDRALGIDPQSVAARIERANLRLFEGDLARAGIEFAAARALAPRAPEVEELLARILAASGRPDDAVAAARGVLAATDDLRLRGEAHRTLCLALVALRRSAEADAAFRAAIEDDPAAAWLKSEYALLLGTAERWDEAMKFAEEALAQSDAAAAHRALAGACFGRGKVLYWEERRFVDAGRDFQCAIRHAPDNANAFYLLGLALRDVARETRNRDLEAPAREAFARAVALDPGQADAARELKALEGARR